ncbi:hypothetical protein ONZ45_g10370 [Pleurotus djamor]|nr:hypothetical protein ONZ45_g10370 [Pleurotus djamor]
MLVLFIPLLAALFVDAEPVVATPFISGQWSIVQEGTSGVSAMQLAVVTETKAIIFDKVESNTLQINGHSAWTAEIDIPSRTVRPLNAITNTWCATGSFLSNGTFVHSAGNPFVDIGQNGVGPSGLQSVRLFTPCDDASCDIIESPQLRLTSKRWYASSARLEDGSVFILGGSTTGNFANNERIHNPTFEFFPPKNIHGANGLQIHNQFMVDSLNSNHFPNVHTLPDGTLFVSANQQAMIFDWKTNTERRLPNFPNGVRFSSPFSGSAVLLPLTEANNFTPEIMICGGSLVDDQLDPIFISLEEPASAQCARLVLTEAGIRAGWKVEQMPSPRIMVELILLPDGRVALVNGAGTGAAGYDHFNETIGSSDADHPALTAVVYDPNARPNQRFSSAGIPASEIPRMYHSTASLVPDGTGSNPNLNVSTVTFAQRMEFLSPPYMAQARPSFTGLPATVDFGKQFTLNVDLPSSARGATVVLMDLGFATHGVHMDQKLVQLGATLSRDKKTLRVTSPPNPRLFSPGPGFIFVVSDDGVPSTGKRVIIGTGAPPPVDEAAIANLLSQTEPISLDPGPPPPATGEGSDANINPLTQN